MNANATDKKIVFSYEGPFNMRIISSLGKYLAEYLDASFETRMSLYRVFIEISQNVALYSEDRVKQELDNTVGVGKVHIETDGKSYFCTTKNRIRPEHGDILINYCQRINEATTNDLIKLKEKLRRESSIKDNGAHIGLISIRLFSKNLLDVSITKENDNTYFTISSIIS
ncbi:MAG: SiaB family protein kinase [Bacteroidales bacterium]|nr:SiaB family protein kinase [Bacteroidales bacterium]